MNTEIKSNFEIENIANLINTINGYIKELNQQNIKDEFEIELKIMENYPESYQNYPFLIKKLCKKDDISMVYHMLNNLKKVESGESSFEKIEHTLGEELAHKYLYPKLKNKS